MSARVTAEDGLPAGALVVGVGLDLCEVPRVARALDRHGARFVEKLFRPGEVRRPPNRRPSPSTSRDCSPRRKRP